jgi:two-component system, chemotaxis family, sensor kinase CheA
VDTARYTALFVAESRDHLQECNRLLLRWERDPGAREPLDGLFRATHTIKGMAASLGFVRLTEFAHAFEHLLQGVRDGAAPPRPDLVDLAFQAVDRLEQGVALAASGRDAEFDAADLVTALAAPSGRRRRRQAVPVRAPSAGSGVPVRVRLRTDAAMPAARIALVLARAARFGPVSDVTPAPESWTDVGFSGSVQFRVQAEVGAEVLRRALLQVGDVEEVEVRSADAPVPTGGGQVRVDLDRLDTLVALAGEVVVVRNRLAALLDAVGDPVLVEEGHRLGRLVTDLHGQVLHTRMTPVGEVFERFPRAVRDLARRLGKQLRFEVAGGDIELDRAILGELPDVLLHLLRNAVDHGLETPEARATAGKPPEGLLRLQAGRERNMIVITVEDDGRGIDREAVLARASAGGWVVAAGDGDDEALLRLLAQPGFSTAEHVTEVSGRGVGIDAVMHRVRALGGAAALETRAGVGTTIVLRLPLTRAILPALLVRIGNERYAVPLEFIEQTVRLPAETAGGRTVEHGGESLLVHDLGVGPARSAWRPAVLFDVAGRRGAVLADTLLGQEDVVVSPVDAPRGAPAWINGATILADGRPALMLDPTALVV